MASYQFASPGFLKKNPEANGTVTFAIIIDRNVVPSVSVTFTAANSARVAITVSPETIPDFVDKSVLDAIRMLSVLTPVPFILENIQVCGPDLHKNAGALQNIAFRAWERSQAGMRTGQQMHNVLARSQTYLDKVSGSNWSMSGPAGLTAAVPSSSPVAVPSGSPVAIPAAVPAAVPAGNPVAVPALSVVIPADLNAAKERVLLRLTTGGGAPNFTLENIKNIQSSHNFIATTRGNTTLTPEEVELVRKDLAKM